MPPPTPIPERTPKDKGVEIAEILSVVALIISITSLVVTTSQLLIELYATADGYRKCGERVIGVWSKGRKREYLPAEFRFEVSYKMPQIALFTPQELEEAEKDYDNVYPVHCYRPKDATLERKTLTKTVHPLPSDLSKVHSEESLTSVFGSDVEKSPKRLSWMKPVGERIRSRPDGNESQTLVSWLRFLQDLHSLYASYWPGDCDHNDCKGRKDPNGKRLESMKYEILRRRQDLYRSRADVVVICRQWSWDFMPPEVVRPLAQTNVADIIVLAQRLGMQWRALDPQDGKLQADGNGFNLSGTDVHGLGIVLRIRVAGERHEFSGLIPSRAVDKMMFGIIPGCPKLVRRDFSMVDDCHEVRSIHAEGGILSILGVDEPLRTAIGERRDQCASLHNDLIMLLCPFLPLPELPFMRVQFTAWGDERRTVFHHWEGRLALARGLRRRLGEMQQKPAILSKIDNYLDALQKDYSNDFFARWNEPTNTHNKLGWKGRSAMIDLCRAAFDYTTETLLSPPFSFGDRDALDQRRYLHLVAAHVFMAAKAMDAAEEKLLEEGRTRRDFSQAALRRDYNVPEKQYGTHFLHSFYVYGQEYIDSYRNEVQGIGAYLKRKDIELGEVQAEEAWWLLVLRGMASDMAIWQGPSLGMRVPSSFYTNKTAVWIT